AFDGDDLVGGLHAADRDRARAHHFAVDVHRAGAALRDAAAVFRAGQADVLADDPQERRVVLDAHVADLAVDVQLSHVSPPSTAYGRHIVLAFSAGLRPAPMPVVLAVEESLAQRPGAAYAVLRRSQWGRRLSQFTCADLKARHARPCAWHPRLGAKVRRGWPGQARP